MGNEIFDHPSDIEEKYKQRLNRFSREIEKAIYELHLEQDIELKSIEFGTSDFLKDSNCLRIMARVRIHNCEKMLGCKVLVTRK